VFSALSAIIKNAFIQAINGDIEESVELQTLSEPALPDSTKTANSNSQSAKPDTR
jgi:hypothetical protein